MKINRSIALVTGASSGIGEATAQRLAQAGYKVYGTSRRGAQLREISRLIEAGAIRPVIDRAFPFESTNEALAYLEAGRAKGKVVVKIKQV